MKKLLLSFMLGASLCAPAIAQLDPDKTVQFGLRGVVNGSWVGDLPKSVADVQANRDNMQLGYAGGVWLRLRVPVVGIYFQPELNITQQNGKYSYQINPNTPSPASSTNTLNLTNVEMPLSLGFRLKLGQIGLRLNAGGMLAGILNAKEVNTQSVTAGGISTQISQTQSVKDQMNALQAGILGGVGLDLGSRLSLDLRLQQNLTNLYDQSEALVSSSPVPQNQKVTNFQLVAGFRLF